MNAKHLRVGAVLLCLLPGGCDDDGSSASLQLEALANRTAGNAPLEVLFEARIRRTSDAAVGALTYHWAFGDGEESAEPRPTHTFNDAGAYTVTLSVTDESDGAEGTATVFVDVSPAADLGISDVSFSPRRARAGSSVAVVWGFENAGAAVIGAWTLSIVLSRDEAFDGEDLILRTLDRSNEPTASARSLEQMVELPPDLESRDYFVGVVADPEHQIGDRDPTNNTAFAPFALEIRNPTDTGPDLAICAVEVPAFELLPAGVLPVAEFGDQLAVEICVRNDGDRSAPRAAYQILLLPVDDSVSGEAGAGPRLDRRYPIVVGGRQDVPLGSADRETFDDLIEIPLELPPEIAAAPPERWGLLVVADPDEALEEQLEDNNERAYAHPFRLAESGSVEGVDLAITSFEVQVEGERTFWGQTLAGAVTLENRGDTAVERLFVVRVIAEPVMGRESVQLTSLNVPGIAAGGEERLEIPLRITRRVTPGRYRITTVADPTNGLDDVNPGNNRRTLLREVELGGEPELDPSPSAVTFSPAEVNAGDPLIVDAIIENVGADPTGPIEAIIVLSDDDTYDRDDTVIDQWVVDSIAGRDQAIIRREPSVPADLDRAVSGWRVGVVVDPENRLSGELDEDNNEAFAAANLVVRGATGGCGEDLQHEPNNRFGDAAAIEAGELLDLGVCDDADWFVVEVGADASLTVRIEWDPEDGQPTLDLVGSDGAVDRSGEPPGRLGALVVFDSPRVDAGQRWIRVTGGGSRFQYNLYVDLVPAGDLPNLRLRSIVVTPAVLQAGASAILTGELVNVGGAEAGPSTVRAQLSTDPLGAPGEEVADWDALTRIDVPAVGAGAVHPFEVELQLPEGSPDGAYWVRAVADSSESVDESVEGDNLGFFLVRVDAMEACVDDGLEPNRSPHESAGGAARPALIEPGEYAGLSTCIGDDDWYSVALEVGERLDVQVEFRAVEGDVDLELYGSDGERLIERSASLQDREQVGLQRVAEAGTYYIRVFLNPVDDASRSNEYGLRITVDQPLECVDDDHEPNEASEAATLLPDGLHDLVLCPGNEDWFRFNIPAGNTVSFHVASGAAGVSIALFGPGGALIEERRDRITLESEQTGFYRLRAWVEADEAVPYTLRVGGVSGIDLVVESFTVVPDRVAIGDDMRAQVGLANLRGDTAEQVLIRYWLSDDDQPSANDLVLGEHRVPLVEGAAQMQIGQKLTLPRDADPESRFVVVSVDPEREIADLRPANNVAAVEIEIGDGCVDDDPRANEGPATATPLDAEAGQFEGGVICPYTEDWFSLDVAGPGQVEIAIELDHAQGDLDLEVYEAVSMVLLGHSRSEDDVESVALDLEAESTVLIRVDGFLGAQAPYTLHWNQP